MECVESSLRGGRSSMKTGGRECCLGGRGRTSGEDEG